MSNSGVLDTRFRSALERMAVQGRLNAYIAPIDPHLEVAAVRKLRTVPSHRSLNTPSYHHLW